MNDYTKPKSTLNAPTTQNNEVKSRVIVSGVKDREKNMLQRFADYFFIGDAQTIKEYAIKDVIIPAIKRTFRNLIMNSLDMTLFGEPGKPFESGYYGGGGASKTGKYTSYSSYYGAPGTPKSSAIDTFRKPTDYRKWLFASPNECEEIIGAMQAEIDTYDRVRLRQLCEWCGKPFSPADELYGWVDISGATYRFVADPKGDGYVLDLPPQIILNR